MPYFKYKYKSNIRQIMRKHLYLNNKNHSYAAQFSKKTANILAMIQLEQKTALQIAKEISERIAKRRKELHFTQAELAKRAGISFASYKRFEQKHEISFVSLIKIAIALNLEKEFDSLFSKKQFLSIEELIADEKNK